mgnify:CR=1 FL=1
MKKNLTEIVFILDRSGSMAGLEDDTIGGFNAMIEKQKREDGEALVSTVLFDNDCEVIHDRVDIQRIEPMTRNEYYVRGCTALLDAVGGAIHHIGNVHKYAREEDRPEKTLFVITTDGSISDIPREEYEEAEARVVEELNGINKPFAVVLNCKNPQSEESKTLAAELTEKYGKPVIPLNCLEIGEQEIKEILTEILLQFPVKEIGIKIPRWLTVLPKDHWLKKEIFSSLRSSAENITSISEIKGVTCRLSDCEYVSGCTVEEIDLGKGAGYVKIDVKNELFYQILGETTGLQLHDEGDLMPCMIELAEIKRKYEKVKAALDEVQTTGYGIVMPDINELTLAEPEIVKQGGKYGVRLRAQAPSIHMMSANIETEVSPVVGSERQSEELIHYLLKEFEENPTKIWESNIFGKSLHELVNEGLHNKLYRMPSDARAKLQETIERIINEGCGGLFCIIL